MLRIEDIDTPRVVPGSADSILRALERYSLLWDGEVSYQSRRTALYQQALDALAGNGLAYPCTCSRRDLRASARRGSSGRIYPGTCRFGARDSRPAAIRLLTDNASYRLQDRIQGEFSQRLESEVGDFVLRRADGVWAYQLAVVVDDADQGITDVVRGSDLLDSTPRQLYLQRLLGLPRLRYAHLPVARNPAGDKLSKQTGAKGIDLQDPGPTLMAALRFLGQQPPDELERASLAALWQWTLAHWDIARVPKRTGATASL